MSHDEPINASATETSEVPFNGVKPEPIQVTRNIIEVMSMNREQRRRIAKINGLKNIPSIENVSVRKATKEEIENNGKL